jgi:hypothetical protein
VVLTPFCDLPFCSPEYFSTNPGALRARRHLRPDLESVVFAENRLKPTKKWIGKLESARGQSE